MIKCRHSRLAKSIFHPYVMYLLKRYFHSFHLLGEIPEIDPTLPVLLLPNHSTWWDGFFVYLLNEKFINRPMYLMMLEDQLSRFKFFSYVGAYSINPQNPKTILQSLTYTIDLLKGTRPVKPVVCIFPQGELQPWGKRPLKFKRGVAWLLKSYQQYVNLLPLAIKAELLGEQRAEVFFLFGQNSLVNRSNFQGITFLEKTEEDILEELHFRIINREKGQLILKGHTSVNEKRR